jgi:uncharacterized protein YggU (UPF0235/DUF167 family)
VSAAPRLDVRLTPSGGADRIDGVQSEADGVTLIKARVRAAPEDGAANAALEALLARALGVAKSRVRVVHGATARRKQVAVEGCGQAELAALIAALPVLAKDKT